MEHAPSIRTAWTDAGVRGVTTWIWRENSDPASEKKDKGDLSPLCAYLHATAVRNGPMAMRLALRIPGEPIRKIASCALKTVCLL